MAAAERRPCGEMGTCRADLRARDAPLPEHAASGRLIMGVTESVTDDSWLDSTNDGEWSDPMRVLRPAQKISKERGHVL